MQNIPDRFKEMGLTHLSASSGTEEKYLLMLKYWLRHNHNMQFPGSARMITGSIVQEGSDCILGLHNFDPEKGQQDGMDVAESTRHMMSLYDEYSPRNFDDGKDAEDYEAFRDYLSDMLGNAVAAVKEWSNRNGINQLNGEHKTWHHDPRIEVPIMLFKDYYGGNFQADLKCKLPQRNPLKKDGTRTWRVPKPDVQPTWQNIWQQSVYYKATGEKPSLLHVTASGFHIWDETNCEALTEDSLAETYEDVVRSWMITENLFKAANGNWNTLFGLVQPDFMEIERRHGPEILALARGAWK